MKKYYFIIISYFCFISAGYSQDKIITNINDTIDCKITKISNKTIFFEVTTKGVKSIGSLTLGSILSYSFGEKSPYEFHSDVQKDSFDRLRIGISGGLGYLLSSSDEAEDAMTSMGFEAEKVKSYYKDLRGGTYANADISWIFSVKYGAGVKYKFFDTSGKIDGFIDPQDGVNLYYVTFSEHIYVNYFAGAFYYEEYLGRRKSFILNSGISMGLVKYRDEVKSLNNYLLTGESFGMDVDLGVERALNRHFSLRADISYFTSTISNMKVSDGSTVSTINLEKDNYENLSRLNFSIGLIIYLGKK
jgi:hypothetical protein